MARTAYAIATSLALLLAALFLLALFRPHDAVAYDVFASPLAMFGCSWFGGWFTARQSRSHSHLLTLCLAVIFGTIAALLFALPHYTPELQLVEIVVIVTVSTIGPILGVRYYAHKTAA